MNAWGQSPPGKPTLISPQGTIGTATPVYQWNEVATATQYYLWVNNPASTPVVQQFYSSSACSGGACQASPSTSLVEGNHTWWVQASNAGGAGPWSDAAVFTVSTGVTPPGQPALVSPQGTINTSTPTYTWNQVANATQYYLWVNNPAGTAVIQQIYSSTACSGGTCSATPATALVDGTHRWWVQASNAGGAGPWSADMTFTVSTGVVPPGQPTLISPEGTVTATTPTYMWNAVATATQYNLWVNGPSGAPVVQQFYGSTACSGGTCSVTPSTTLVDGTHTWWVRASNAGGSGPWSAAKTFTVSTGVAPPAQPTLIAPEGTITSTTPTYRWNVVATATQYHLWVNNAAGTPAVQQFYGSTACSGGTCSATPNSALVDGSHTWWVRASNAGGSGPWSAGKAFTVFSGVAPPGQPTLGSPEGTITTNAPTYSWNEVSTATQYYLWVNDPSGTPVIQQFYTATICSGGTCSALPATTLLNGTHRWWVQASNSGGSGPWSAAKTFTVASSALPPSQPQPVSPQGTITTNLPTYTWNEAAAAGQYYLWVNNAAGTPVIQQFYASTLCSGGTCSVTPTTALGNGAHSWWVQASNAAGNSPWSAGMGFTVVAPPSFAEIVVDASEPTDPWMKAMGDIDGDNRVDLLVAGRGGPVVYYAYPSWTKVVIATTVNNPGSSTDMALADLDRDGDLDVVLANGQWFENPRPSGNPAAGAWTARAYGSSTAHDVVVGDLDNDGDLDIVIRGQDASGATIEIYRQNNASSWTLRTLSAPAGEGLALGNMDSDADLDIVIGGRWYESTGDIVGGSWTAHVFASWTADAAVAVGDINNDGRKDVVLSQSEGPLRLSWFEAPPDPRSPSWPERGIRNPFEFAHGIELADVDNDGRLDVVSAEMHQSSQDRVAVFYNGGGGASWSMQVLSTQGSHNVAVGDVDHDGDVDLMGANWNSAQAPDGASVKLWRNRLVP